MSTAFNKTHDPALRSWVASANQPDTDFPIQNLPFGVFRSRSNSTEAPRCGVAIGDHILDVSRCSAVFDGLAADAAAACGDATLNRLMAMGNPAASALRAQLSASLAVANAAGEEVLAPHLHPVADQVLLMPVRVGGYTDFFASVHHATNAGRLFRPDAPLLPNYKYVPVAYNGRANSLRVSGDKVQRPWGQTKAPDADAPSFTPVLRLDYEVELGFYIGTPTQHGAPVAVGAAWDHIFGFCLLNDWSARDIQSWEYQPLGPFLAKSFATSVSPWVVTSEALAPYHLPAFARPAGDPMPMPHLHHPQDQQSGAVAITLEARLRTTRMAQQSLPAQVLSRSDTASLYWTFAQMVAHHTSNGSALDCGDLLGSGTVSGDSADALGSLLEISRGGTQPLLLQATGETRTWLADGDELTLAGYCERAGHPRIGFGTCSAMLLPAHAA